MISPPVITFKSNSDTHVAPTLASTIISTSFKSNINKQHAPTLASAILSASLGSEHLIEWTLNWLTGAGGEPVLAEFLRNRKQQVNMRLVQKYPLCTLTRRNGSASDCANNATMIFIDDEWDERVASLKDAMTSSSKKENEKFMFPPLITFGNPTTKLPTTEIRDGAHRMEALLQLGHDCYWVIVVEAKPYICL